ncbi:hypothetical protein [Actinomadura sp. GTD37]|uniref:hypothetical protein n=1 Tax=Actinomadura sp. GTD37 TaxID=1778030 RepID=UPI0035C0D8B5
MSRRVIAGLVLAALAAGPLTGCGGAGDAGPGGMPGATGSAVSAKPRAKAGKETVAWAGRVCDALSGGLTKSPPPKIDPKDVAESERAIAAYMTGMAKRLGTVRTRLAEVGPPPVPTGQALLTGMGGDLKAVQGQLLAAASGLRETKAGTPAFRTAQGNAGKAMRRLGGYQPPTRALRADLSLGDAFTRAAPCREGGV